jgi:hypothetical protein
MNMIGPSLKISACILAFALSACGGGGGDSTTTSGTIASGDYTSSNLALNAIAFSVQNISGNNVNFPYVSVTICQPGTSKCQIVPNILLDTGSIGFRVLSSALGDLQLASQTYNNVPVAECAEFLSGVTWGPVKIADIKMSAEVASSLPIQVINDANYASVPTGCSNGLPTLQTSSTLNANGILGVGLFVADGQNYYACPSNLGANCRANSIPLPPSSQVQNPVAAFATNNNGIVMQLPSISSSGAASVTGSLFFGIDTQANNSSSGVNIIPTNSFGYFTTTFNGVSTRISFIDSGSNGLFFPAGNQSTVLIPCTTSVGFYCPATTQSYTATVPLKNNVTGTINFSIANTESQLQTRNAAFNNIGGPLQGYFDWGLPFFFGKTVYFGIAGKASTNNVGPYYGYKN